MKLMDRDKEFLRFTNGFGCVCAHHLSTQFHTPMRVVYRRLQKLKNEGYIEYQPYLKHEAGVYLLTDEGANVINDNLKPMRRINKGMIDHDLALVDLAIKITGTNEQFIPERRIRQYPEIWAFSDHIPDGFIKKSNGDLIAIELELSVKSKERLESIFDFYSSHSDINYVYYYVGDKYVENVIQKMVNNYGLGRVNIFLL